MRRWIERIQKHVRTVSYPRMVAAGYLGIILFGALLLSLPTASRTAEATPFLNALFTATSATCVTGLIAYDTYTHWSLFGQLVILGLIQIGGLGFMTIITMFPYFTGRKISLKTRDLLRESVNSLQIGGIMRLFKMILCGTFLIEGVGAVLLSIRFVPEMGWTDGIYYGIFHAVSAFCNAGFDLMGRYGPFSSLTPFREDPVVLLTVSMLILIGGIGFFVWEDLLQNRHHFRKYALHTKVVLAVTGLLTLAGTLLFWLYERSETLSGLPVLHQWVNAFFGSVSPRTAGFNSVDLAGMSGGGTLLTIVYMVIGGSPGSTAGGIKTTTLAVMILSLWASLRGTRGENVFGRRLEENSLHRAAAVLTTDMGLGLIGSALLCLAEPTLTFTEVIFEAFSAINTVGLTLGITPMLGAAGKLILALMMICGRVGSVSFALLLTAPRRPVAAQLPEGKLSIG